MMTLAGISNNVRHIVQANSASPHFIGADSIDYLVQIQQEMKKRFERLDFQPAHMPQIITYANFIATKLGSKTVVTSGSTFSLGPSMLVSGASSSLLLLIRQIRRRTPQRSPSTRRTLHLQPPCQH